MPPLERETARGADGAGPLRRRAAASAARTVQWVSADAARRGRRARSAAQATAILAHVRAVGAAPVAKLEAAMGQRARSGEEARRAGPPGGRGARARRSDPFFAEPVPRDAPHDATEAQTDGDRRPSGARCAKRVPTTFLASRRHRAAARPRCTCAPSRRRASAARGAIVLVPEIALTPQLVARFRARFGDDVAVLHSGLTPRERLAMWTRLRAGEVDVAIGARSALFAPGAQPRPRHRRRGARLDASSRKKACATTRATWPSCARTASGGVCVLGSATPSLETEHLARTGRATKLRLPVARALAADAARRDRRPAAHRARADRRQAHQHAALPRASRTTLAAQGAGDPLPEPPRLRAERPVPGLRASWPRATRARWRSRSTSARRLRAALPLLRLRGRRSAPRCAKCQRRGARARGLGTEKLEETLATRLPGGARRAARPRRGERQAQRRGRARRGCGRARSTSWSARRWSPRATTCRTSRSSGVINADAALIDPRLPRRRARLPAPRAGRRARRPRRRARGGCSCRPGTRSTRPSRCAAKHDVDGVPRARARRSRGSSATRPSRAARSSASTSMDEAEARQRLHAAGRRRPGLRGDARRRGARPGPGARAHRARAQPLPLPRHAPGLGAPAAPRGARRDRRGARGRWPAACGRRSTSIRCSCYERFGGHEGTNGLGPGGRTVPLHAHRDRTAGASSAANGGRARAPPRAAPERGAPAAVERGARRRRRHRVAHVGVARRASPPARVEAGAGIRAAHHAPRERAEHRGAAGARRGAPGRLPERATWATGSTWIARVKA